MDSEDAEPTYLGVREAARRLGVHENTVRNWARAGILESARIPGSRFHRFDARDVERLRQERGATVSSLEEERRTIGPELIDATQLSHWATTRDAQATFPELIRRLLVSTPGVTNVSVRAGEGVSAPGWDGHAESTGARYLPAGPLFFELGVGGRPKEKADADYEKRRDEFARAEPAEGAFVFATPRRWSGAEAWEEARRAERAFSDVRVLDADDLEGWLQATPAVHYWISERLGRKPRDAETLERWWARFQASTDPALPAVLFLAGRDGERKQLVEFFEGEPGVIAVQGRWRDEAIAFVCATIETMEREGERSVQPAVIVSSADVWDRIVAEPGRMTLVPIFPDPDIAIAQERGHHTVLVAGLDQVVRGEKIELPRPDRRATGDALEAVGIDSDHAYRLAALARRSMPSLVRKLARDPRFARPPWSQPPDAGILAPLVLVGGWTPSDGDRAVVSRIADEEWPPIERTLTRWRKTEDPPFVVSGEEWHLASAEEAFLLLRDSLTTTDLARWEPIAIEVLLEADPALELTMEDRPMAGLTGATREHSSTLRRGLAEGIALFGSLGDERLADGITGADHARRVVGHLLGRANEAASGRIWWSLADVLPLLAEAAPDAFLDAVHDDLDSDEPLLRTMFQDSDQTSALFSSSPHTGLLWALEGLCWSEDHLLEASRALARLQQVDPGGRLGNRPLASLNSVLVGWIRHTAAPLDVRVRAVEQICRQIPPVGWQLVLGLWPSHHATSSPPSMPRYRDWRPESRGVPISEWVEYIGKLVGLSIDLAATDPVRWADLAERLSPLPPADRDRLLQSLDAFAHPDSLDTDGEFLLWERLHLEVARHRRFSEAEWSMDEEDLSRMQAIAERLEPVSRVDRHGYLFDWRPDLPEVDASDHESYDERLAELRTRAVDETLETAGVPGLRDLAERAPVPTQLGWTVGAVAPDDLTPALLSWLDAENPKLRDVAASWASRRLHDDDTGWLLETLARPEMTAPARREALALQAPATSQVWDALADLEPELADAYWEHVGPWRVRSADVERAARELLARGRAWTAIDLLAADAHGKDNESSGLARGLVEEVLNAAMAADPEEARSQSAGYEVGLLLDHLEGEGVGPETLARYEFMFFRLLEHHRQPRALYAALSADPTLFIDLVKRVYRGKNEPKRQLNEHDSALAHHAWWILNEWHGIPGQLDDGTVDGEHLTRWVQTARLALADADRADIGDEQIGQVLSASPSDPDGVWPATPVRELVETFGSTSIETGIHLGVVNARGVTSRGVYDGGQQERELAARYREWAKATAGDWPRTSRMLRRLAEDFERDARREDARAEVTADIE